MGRTYLYILTYRLIDGIIYSCSMVSFSINHEVMSRVGAQYNETFWGWHKIQRRDTTPVKISTSKTNNWFEKVGNIISTSGTILAFINILKLF